MTGENAFIVQTEVTIMRHRHHTALPEPLPIEQRDILRQLLTALQDGGSFQPALLYRLDYPLFELALQLLEDWRLGCHLGSHNALHQRLFADYPTDLLADTPSTTTLPHVA
ncbi:MAG: hypothetical protein ACK4FZ_02820 [Vogesella sp.]|uniref:hypothetical protein n=1 Tax=Vogesella sp. TaxID=1904252 RepID=UPI00391B690D